MDKERILGILRAHEPELKAAGLLHLRLFGSVARGDNNAASDVDLLFDYDESATRNLLIAYGFQDRLAEMLGTHVHLSSSKHIRSEFRDRVLQEAVSVF